MQDSGALQSTNSPSPVTTSPKSSDNLSKENRAEEINALLEPEKDLTQGPGSGIDNVLGYPAAI